MLTDRRPDSAATKLLGGAPVYKRLLEDSGLRHGAGVGAYRSSARGVAGAVARHRRRGCHATSRRLCRLSEVVRRRRLRHCRSEDFAPALSRFYSFLKHILRIPLMAQNVTMCHYETTHFLGLMILKYFYVSANVVWAGA